MKRITDEQFDAKLIELLNKMTGAQLLSMPGIYEIVSEELNNAVFDAINAERV